MAILYQRAMFTILLYTGRFQKKKENKEWIYPFGLAGWGQHRAKIQLKKIVFQKKYKDYQNGIIHPEN